MAENSKLLKDMQNAMKSGKNSGSKEQNLASLQSIQKSLDLVVEQLKKKKEIMRAKDERHISDILKIMDCLAKVTNAVEESKD